MVRQIGRSAIRTRGWPEARVRQPAYRLRQRPHLQGIDLNRAAGEIVNLVDRNGSAVERMQGHRGNCSRRRFDRIPWPSDPLPGSRPDRAPASRSCAEEPQTVQTLTVRRTLELGPKRPWPVSTLDGHVRPPVAASLGCVRQMLIVRQTLVGDPISSSSLGRSKADKCGARHGARRERKVVSKARAATPCGGTRWREALVSPAWATARPRAGKEDGIPPRCLYRRSSAAPTHYGRAGAIARLSGASGRRVLN
jgi:hypothetical protein